MKLFYCLIFFAAAVKSSDYGNFDRAQVISVIPKNEKEIAFLRDIYDNSDYDFWTPVSRIGVKVDILTTKKQLVALINKLKYEFIDYSIKIKDVGQAIEESLSINEAAKERAAQGGKPMEWTAYYALEDIYAWMEEQAQTYPDLVTVTNIGQTYEGRDIKLLTISTGINQKRKPAIFSEATIHAREWIAPATLTWIINELLTNQNKYKSSLDAVDFYFVVISNPDGYHYSWKSKQTRLWRKNRQPYGNCIGADPNRNFKFKWAEVGTSTNPCSQIFHGANPNSENCTRVLSEQILSEAKNTRVYLGFHSYAEQWLRPWGYQPVETKDATDVISLCEKAVASAASINGVSYSCVLGGFDYQAGGVSDDFAYKVGKIKYSYTIELRDQGYGFLLPPSHIIPSGEELFASFKVIFEYVRDNPNDKRN